MKTTPRIRSRKGEPPWEIAELYTLQGYWDEEEYLALETNRLIEFSNGFIEVLPLPTTTHQLIVGFLLNAVHAFVEPRKLGMVLFAGIRVRLWKGTFREPDIVFMLAQHSDRIGEAFWIGADLVMEVVSGSKEDRRRDRVVKRREYAKARIPEYWVVDPEKSEISVLRLSRGKYLVAGKYGPGGTAKSVLLDGFAVNVDDVLQQKPANGARR
jgi:Uma2 family endonuclease